jgi:AcrR family transcriptional regulator
MLNPGSCCEHGLQALHFSFVTGSPQASRHRARDRARLVYRDAILDAAEEELAASGFHAARVQDIAARAGVAVGTFYNHFETKEDVLVALLDLRMRELAEALAATSADPERWEDRAAARLERVLAYKDRHAAFFALAVEHGLLGDATAAAKQLLGGRSLPHVGRFDRAFLELVDDGVASGAIARGDRDLHAAFLKGTTRAVARWARGKGSVLPRHIAETIIALFLQGASPERSASPRAAGARSPKAKRAGTYQR